MSTTTSQLSAALTAASLPTPSAHFLSTLLSTNRAAPPLPALLATAKHRLLSSDFSVQPSILDPSTLSFPTNLSNPSVKELNLAGPIPVQVLGIEDLSKSRWEQIEAIEAQERGESTRGREIIRVVASEEGENGQEAGQQSAASSGPHKLVLQDVKGQRVYGLELKAVKGVGLGMSIGTKILLKGVTVARGVVLLEPDTAILLGGKIEAAHKLWVENRKEELKRGISDLA